jgi:hypothetical protein
LVSYNLHRIHAHKPSIFYIEFFIAYQITISPYLNFM